MGQLISTASNSSYKDFDTSIPELDESANIIEAFRLYHYGKSNYIDDSTPDSKSIHSHLNSLQNRIASLENNPVVPVDPLLLMGA